MSAGASLLSLRKAREVEGTWEEPDVAFQLFAGEKPEIFGSYGFHACPHIGAYNSMDYTPTLPIALVSFPIVDVARQFPADVATLTSTCISRGLLEPRKLAAYLIIHSGLDVRPCGHLKCSNEGEFNLMYHAWAFAGDGVADSDDAITASVHMGVFEPHGVAPVHTDLSDGGVAFGRLSQRKVILHDRRFSPNNANVLTCPDVTDTAVFVSMGIDRVTRAGVVAVHVLPRGDAPSDALRAWMRGRATLAELMDGLREHVPRAAEHVQRMLSALP